MNPRVHMFSKLNLGSDLSFDKNHNEFPSAPNIGQVSLVNNILWLFTNLDGLDTWYPLSRRKNSYLYSQGVNALEWTINHNLNSMNVIFVVYDHDNNVVYPNKRIVDENTVTLNFAEAVRGKCIVYTEIEMEAVNSVIRLDQLIGENNYQSKVGFTYHITDSFESIFLPSTTVIGLGAKVRFTKVAGKTPIIKGLNGETIQTSFGNGIAVQLDDEREYVFTWQGSFWSMN